MMVSEGRETAREEKVKTLHLSRSRSDRGTGSRPIAKGTVTVRTRTAGPAGRWKVGVGPGRRCVPLCVDTQVLASFRAATITQKHALTH